jgi:hypothetical protein
LLLLVKNIKDSLNEAWEVDGYTYKGLNNAAQYIQKQMESYMYEPSYIADNSCGIEQIYLLLDEYREDENND